MSTQSSTTPCSGSKIRCLADFHPSLWGNHFLACSSETIDATTQQQWEEQKAEVKRMITSTATNKPVAQKSLLQLIDAIQRLGVAYHFEKEIEDALDKIFHGLDEDNDIGDDDLHTVSLRFRLLRQQGIMISCDVFNKFRDEESKFFKESLRSNVEGILSLYEAAYLSIRGEEILDEAINFTTSQLKSMLSQVHPNFAQQINHALYRPLRKAVPRVEARNFLDTYATEELHHQTLLKFAKLDFNILQAQHQKELQEMTRWWKDLDFSTKVQYARDRLVECYFWMMGVYFEPKYTLGRKILTKVLCLTSVLDDTFDAYGTFEELQLFAEAVKRWDIGAKDILPKYMRTIYKALLDIYSEIENELTKEGRSHCVRYAKRKVQALVAAYFAQAKWFNEDYVPIMEEYNPVALTSSAISMIVANSFLAMGNIATVDAFKWLDTNPKIVTAAELIGRFLNDIEGHESEQNRGHIPSAVECYMKQYDVSEEEAIQVLKKEVANAWKDINEECLINPTAIPFPLLERILNLARTCDMIYKDGDRYTNSYLMKDQITSMLKDRVML